MLEQSVTHNGTLKMRKTRVNNPIISAMLSSNNLGNCGEVRDLLAHCEESKSSSIVCDTAARYHEICLSQSPSLK